MSYYLKLQGNNELEFKRKALTILQQMPLYGNSFFLVKNSTDSRIANGGILCIGSKSLIVLDKVTRQTLLTTTFDSIVNFRYDDSEFVMKTGDLMTKAMIRFETIEGFAISDVIQGYINNYISTK